MSKARSLALRVIFCVFATSMIATHANATVIHEVSAAGELTGARNVNVNGTLYDVAFHQGTCIGLFDGCHSTANFQFSTLESATAAGQALLDQVFLDVLDGPFDSSPRLTFGCLVFSSCISLIPFETLTLRKFRTIEVRNLSFDRNDSVRPSDFLARVSTEFHNVYNYAIFSTSTVSPTAIPEPATLSLFGLGLLGLTGVRRLRRKASSTHA